MDLAQIRMSGFESAVMSEASDVNMSTEVNMVDDISHADVLDTGAEESSSNSLF